MRVSALLGVAAAKVQGGCPRCPNKRCGGVIPAVQTREPDHWFMVPARIEKSASPQGSKCALGLPQPSRKTSRRCPAGYSSAFELTKGPGAPDRTTAMEEEDPALDAGLRRAHRFDAVLHRQGPARTL